MSLDSCVTSYGDFIRDEPARHKWVAASGPRQVVRGGIAQAHAALSNSRRASCELKHRLAAARGIRVRSIANDRLRLHLGGG